MILSFVCLISAAAAFPASVLYDRRQDGDLNVSADLNNIVILVAVPDKMSVPIDLFDGFLKSNKGHTQHHEAQERADHVMDAFVEPNTPYQVDIGSDRSAEGGGIGRAVEVVIAARRRLDIEPQEESSEEIKLLGARENCGPERERDPVTLTCRFKQDSAEDKPQATSIPVQEEAPQQTPEVISS